MALLLGQADTQPRCQVWHTARATHPQHDCRYRRRRTNAGAWSPNSPRQATRRTLEEAMTRPRLLPLAFPLPPSVPSAKGVAVKVVAVPDRSLNDGSATTKCTARQVRQWTTFRACVVSELCSITARKTTRETMEVHRVLTNLARVHHPGGVRGGVAWRHCRSGYLAYCVIGRCEDASQALRRATSVPRLIEGVVAGTGHLPR